MTAKGYGEFLCDVFDVWVVSDVGRTFVQMFDATLAQWCGVPPGVCSMGETCGDALVVEHNGDVYSCDHFVYPEYKLGNIRETPLSEIYRSRKRVDFGLAKRNALPAECLRCKYYFACRGECPKHRFETGSDGCRKNSLCEGLQHWFRHSEPYMEYMRDMLAREQSPAWVMPFARKRMGWSSVLPGFFPFFAFQERPHERHGRCGGGEPSRDRTRVGDPFGVGLGRRERFVRRAGRGAGRDFCGGMGLKTEEAPHCCDTSVRAGPVSRVLFPGRTPGPCHLSRTAVSCRLKQPTPRHRASNP